MEFFILFLVAVFFVIILFKTKTGRGAWGEYHVKKALGKNIIDQQYVIHNLLIVNEGKSSQIDHIVIKRTGIFVIETKNYAGQIYGNENQREWTQVLRYGKIKNRFYNPIMQNRTHIYALSKLLGRSNGFVSIVVFLNATLMTAMPPEVGHMDNIKRIYQQNTKEIISTHEMRVIYEKLLSFKNNPQISEKQHIHNIQVMRAKVENNICPRCGKNLVLRHSQHGQFYGCSGYPQCNFKKTMEQSNL